MLPKFWFSLLGIELWRQIIFLFLSLFLFCEGPPPTHFTTHSPRSPTTKLSAFFSLASIYPPLNRSELFDCPCMTTVSTGVKVCAVSGLYCRSKDSRCACTILPGETGVFTAHSVAHLSLIVSECHFTSNAETLHITFFFLLRNRFCFPFFCSSRVAVYVCTFNVCKSGNYYYY